MTDVENLAQVTDLQVLAKLKVGNMALQQMADGEDLLSAFMAERNAPQYVHDFMGDLGDVAFEMYKSRTITQKGIAFMLTHSNVLFAGFTPLEACAADEVDLAMKAGRYYVGAEHNKISIRDRHQANLIAPKFEAIFGRSRTL